MQDNPPNLIIRQLLPEDLAQAVSLSRHAGWNQRLWDWQMIISAQGLHCAAEIENKVVGTIAALDYGTLHWIAMVLVHPDYRRRGIATTLLNHVLTQNINQIYCLDATKDGAKVYVHFGFEILSKLNRWHFSGTKNKAPGRFNIVPLTDADMEFILQKDRLIFGGDRSYILQSLRNRHSNLAFKIQSEQFNYVLGRIGHHALHIGPLVADNLEIASDLLNGVIARFPGKPFYVDSFHNKEWNEELIHSGFIKERMLFRMQKNNKNKLSQISCQFAIAGPELG